VICVAVRGAVFRVIYTLLRPGVGLECTTVQSHRQPANGTMSLHDAREARRSARNISPH
jgi:hypothetical protein